MDSIASVNLTWMSMRAVGLLRRHCTTTRRLRKNVLMFRLLPVAGVVPGLTGLDWVSAWLEMRSKNGLSASMRQPTMPCPVSGGGWHAAVDIIRSKCMAP